MLVPSYRMTNSSPYGCGASVYRTSSLNPILELANAMYSPSGDHAMWASLPCVNVKRFSELPLGLIVHTSYAPSTRRENMIKSPRGDHNGKLSYSLVSVLIAFVSRFMIRRP